MNLMYLKIQDKTIMIFNSKESFFKILDNNLLPYNLRDNIIDTSNMENITADIINTNAYALFDFFSNRGLSINRENAKFILNQLGISQKNDFETKNKMMLLCKGLSACDDYWITDNENEKWKDVNVRDNPINNSIAQIALFGKSLNITGIIRTPELTGQGKFAKAWFRENGKLYLLKASSKGGNETEREVQTSNLIDCFNVPQVKYKLVHKEGRSLSQCELLNNSDFSIVDAWEVETWCKKCNKDFLSLVQKLDSDTFYKTIIVDYLCSNIDRHGGNWGFFMNNKTGSLICLHPLFDHNNCFDIDFMKDETGGVCQLILGKSQKEAALYAIKHCDFRCTKTVTKDMFLDNDMYESFMDRACILGLYKKQKLSIFDKLFHLKEQYIPVEIKDNNTSEYWDKVKSSLENIK